MQAARAVSDRRLASWRRGATIWACWVLASAISALGWSFSLYLLPVFPVPHALVLWWLRRKAVVWLWLPATWLGAMLGFIPVVIISLPLGLAGLMPRPVFILLTWGVTGAVMSIFHFTVLGLALGEEDMRVLWWVPIGTMGALVLGLVIALQPFRGVGLETWGATVLQSGLGGVLYGLLTGWVLAGLFSGTPAPQCAA